MAAPTATAPKSTEQIAEDLDRAAEAIWNAEFLIVIAGPLFDESVRNPFESDRCDPALVSQPNRFMGFWGGVFNQYNDRNPHEGFSVLSRWRDRFFCQDDVRKRGKKKPSEEESALDRMPRCLVYTSLIGNQFQRLGFPSDEVFDALGNITLWQCSRNPPCCQRATAADRNFRFVIDDATKEAMPVKYVAQRASDKTTSRMVVVDSDDEELLSMVGGASKNPFEVKLSKEERQRRQERRIFQPRVRHLHAETQTGASRFPDLFTGFATLVGQKALPNLFSTGPPQDEQSPRKVPEFPVDEATGVAIPLLPVLRPPNVVRCSHLLAHIDALDIRSLESSVGRFAAVDPDRFSKEREQYATAVGKIFLNDNTSMLMKRVKYITYNISVFVQSADGHRSRLGASRYAAEDQVGLCVPEALRRKLTSVYLPGCTQVPVVNDRHEVVGSMHPLKAAMVELEETVHKKWTQGAQGRFYFSHQPPKQCMYDPVRDCSIDVVRVTFPTGDVAALPDGEALELSQECRISVVCETAVDLTSVPLPEGYKGPALASLITASGSSPQRFVNTWQVVGDFCQSNVAAEPEFKGKDAIEYVLVGRNHHGIRIGVSKANPLRVLYMEIQSLNDAARETFDELTRGLPLASAGEAANSGALGAAFVSHATFTREKVVDVPRAEANKDRPPVPVPNHQLCANCHDIARPFVLMSKPGGAKDEGFCSGLLAARTKQVKAWEKLMTESLKADNSRCVVMLEVGCSAKMDVARSYSEKTFKTLKQSKCTFIRLSPQDLDSKAKKGGEEGNAISLIINPVQALVTIDNLVNERLRKGR